MSLGYKAINDTTGRPISVAAGADTEWMDIGVSIDWDGISAAGSATTLSDDTPIAVGDKYLRYGTIMVPIGVAGVQTITVSGSPTGGTFTPKLVVATGPSKGTYTLAALAYNVSAADMKTAFLTALPNSVTSVTYASSVWTVTFDKKLGEVAAMTGTAALTGGTTPAIAYAATTDGSASNGYWNVWNGSDTLVREYVGILNETIKLSTPSMLQGYLETDTTGLIVGGTVWGERINDTDAHKATLQAALPTLRFARKQ